MTAPHLVAVLLCACGFAFDKLELALGGILAAVFSVPPHAAAANELSLLLASIYIGATLGAPLLGWVAAASAGATRWWVFWSGWA